MMGIFNIDRKEGIHFFRCSSTKVVGLTFGSRNQVFLSHSLCTFSYFIHTFLLFYFFRLLANPLLLLLTKGE